MPEYFIKKIRFHKNIQKFTDRLTKAFERTTVITHIKYECLGYFKIFNVTVKFVS